MNTLTRTQLLTDLRRELEPLPGVLAMCEGGSKAFGKDDAWSDLDIHIIVADELFDQTVRACEELAPRLHPVDLQWSVPQPAWHGGWQTFYRFKHGGPFLLLDFAILKASAPDKFLQPEIHGQTIVHFDKTGVAAYPPPLDPAAWAEKLAARRRLLRTMFELFQPFVLKEIQRGDALAALAAYQAYSLRWLVELLRMRHTPYQYNFGPAHLDRSLPAEVVSRLLPLYYVADLATLAARQAEAAEWFKQL